MTNARRLVRTILLIAAAVSVPLLPAGAAETPANSITVRGSGFVSIKPDQAELSAGVVTENVSAAKALNRNSAAVRKLFKTLSDFGVPTGDVQTLNFSVMPQFRTRDKRRPRRIVGYRVLNQVSIVVRDLDLLGVLLDDLVKQNANRVNGIRFAVTGAEQLADEARQKAVADAKRKAEKLAKAADVDLGKVIRIVADPVRRFAPGFAVGRAQNAPVPIAPGEQKITASVTVTYAID